MYSTGHTASHSHPLSGSESWPRSGPVYDLGPAVRQPKRSFWSRVANWLEEEPELHEMDAEATRIYY